MFNILNINGCNYYWNNYFLCRIKNAGKNEVLAKMELDFLIFQIENKIINLDTLSDQEYINYGHNVAELINIIGKVKSEKEHYFRNYFSRAPLTLPNMIDTIQKNNSLLRLFQNFSFERASI